MTVFRMLFIVCLGVACAVFETSHGGEDEVRAWQESVLQTTGDWPTRPAFASALRSPEDQIWRGSNSILRNPGQILAAERDLRVATAQDATDVTSRLTVPPAPDLSSNPGLLPWSMASPPPLADSTLNHSNSQPHSFLRYFYFLRQLPAIKITVIPAPPRDYTVTINGEGVPATELGRYRVPAGAVIVIVSRTGKQPCVWRGMVSGDTPINCGL